jgi:hypothetical protein
MYIFLLEIGFQENKKMLMMRRMKNKKIYYQFFLMISYDIKNDNFAFNFSLNVN